jgi:NADPH:quinone reductase-like Zn-dependent oxidoreductase
MQRQEPGPGNAQAPRTKHEAPVPAQEAPVRARAFWVAEPGRGEIRDERLPARSDDEVLVRALYSGVSRGTESLVFGGRVPVSEHQRMRAPFQSGNFPAPVKYGYASVGQVEDGPSELVGRTVFTLFPHQTHYVVPRAAVHVVPDGVPAARAVLTANMETAVNVLWDARPHIGDRISVIGAGTVGCLIAWLAARIAGCDVQLVDLNPERATTASALGVRAAIPESADADRDLVIHASGSPAGLQTALGIAAFEATIVEASWFGDQQVPLPLGSAFHARRLRIVSSQVGHVAPLQRARWDSARRLAFALRLLADSALDALITGETPFDSLPDVMPALANGTGHTLCHRIRY